MTVELTRQELLPLVKAARMARRLSRDMRPMLMDGNGWTVADEISGYLMLVLDMVGGEEHGPTDDFDSYAVCMMAESETTDEEMAMELIRMHEKNVARERSTG